MARSATPPVIGITSYAPVEARWGPWSEEALIIPAAYVHALNKAGARSLIVPPDEEAAAQTLDLLDAVVFSGGTDIDPAAYGADPDPSTEGAAIHRDRAELALLEAALAQDMPLLAICRGSQLLNVGRGGDLVQHLPDEVGHDHHRRREGTFSEHDVNVKPESCLGGIVGHRVTVKSHHHQGFGHLGEGLEAVAWAGDGTVEALEDSSRRFALGVLWHPEEGADPALFDALVASARTFRAARSR